MVIPTHALPPHGSVMAIMTAKINGMRVTPFVTTELAAITVFAVRQGVVSPGNGIVMVKMIAVMVVMKYCVGRITTPVPVNSLLVGMVSFSFK